MMVIISDGRTKRGINGPFKIFADRNDLLVIRRRIDETLEDDACDVVWVSIYEEAADVPTTAPVPFTEGAA